MATHDDFGDVVALTTVGFDVGSTTSHLTISRVSLARDKADPSSRYSVVDRQVRHRSPVIRTPLTACGSLDAAVLRDLVCTTMADAAVTVDEIDAGAVIVTGMALDADNSQAIAQSLAAASGTFVCAAAGHHLEATLSAHGSGAVAAATHTRVLNIDIGGGTTKFALAQGGDVLGTLAVNIGARMVQFDGDGRLAHVDLVASSVAEQTGAPTEPGSSWTVENRAAVARWFARALVKLAGLDRSGPSPEESLPGLWLSGRLPCKPANEVMFSGGVSEYVYRREASTFGDLGLELGLAIREAFEQAGATIVEPNEGLRATVIGASQFSTQVSGNTIYLSDRGILPQHNVPVLRLGRQELQQDLHDLLCAIEAKARELRSETGRPIALAIEWDEPPSYRRLYRLATALTAARHTGALGSPFIVVSSDDIARTLGAIMDDELTAGDDLVVIDGLELRDFDYLDLGTLDDVSNVVPAIVKSLLFANVPETNHV